ncbi:protein 60A-like isoform X2 [Megachile rotundata]|uniref:protein 60A-like isoform X2 n=1 Tax=Megachile rotundata TaxID=143995 RepID=UPI003FD156CE
MYKIYVVEVVFLLIIIFYANSETSSGFYIDNGFNQTVLYKAFNYKQKREIERELLNILELPEKPNRITHRALLIKRSAPKFLLNIYKNVLSSDRDTSIQEEFNLNDHYINVIDQSDFIMTFGAHNPYSGNASKTNRGKRIWFDVSEVPREEYIIAAELRLYQSLNENIGFNETYTVAVYRVARTKSGGRIKHFIDSANTVTGKEDWITLNINEALEHWIKYPKENRGLFLAVYHDNYTGHIMRPDDIGIVGVLGIPDKQPFMVGFFKNSGNRSKREVIFKQKKDTVLEKQHFTKVQNPYVDSVTRKRREQICSMKTLYDAYIFLPRGFPHNPGSF